jgi:hypothetical protein
MSVASGNHFQPSVGREGYPPDHSPDVVPPRGLFFGYESEVFGSTLRFRHPALPLKDCVIIMMGERFQWNRQSGWGVRKNHEKY